MSLTMVGLRAIGVPIRLELELAAMLGTQVWLVGLLAYVVIGGITALLYALVFEYILNDAGVGAGLLVGACNAIAAGFIWSQLQGPGQFWDGLGAAGIASLFLVHFVFGGIIGGLYRTKHRLAWA